MSSPDMRPDAMSEQPKLPPPVVAAVQELLGLGDELINALVDALRTVGPSFSSPSVRAFHLHELVGDKLSAEVIERLLRDLLLPLQNWRTRFSMSPTDLYEMISEGLAEQNNSQWPPSAHEPWERLRPRIEALFGADVFVTELRAFQSLSDRPNWVQDLAITSEVRPVFEESDNRLDAVVITNTLKIEYRPTPTSSPRRSRLVYFAIDPADLDALEDQIKLARAQNARLVKQGHELTTPVLMLEREPS